MSTTSDNIYDKAAQRRLCRRGGTRVVSALLLIDGIEVDNAEYFYSLAYLQLAADRASYIRRKTLSIMVISGRGVAPDWRPIYCPGY